MYMKKSERINLAKKELDIINEPKCYCGSDLEFTTKSIDTKYGGWRKYCSRSCMSKSTEIIEKRKKTNLERYGVESYSQIQDFKPWDDETKSKFKEKSQLTHNRKYGVDHYSQTEEYKEKRKKTNLERYGVENTFDLVKNRKSFFSTEKGKEWIGKNNPGPEALKKKRNKALLIKCKDTELVDIITNKKTNEFKRYIHDIADKLKEANRFTISKEVGLSTSYLNKLMRDYDMVGEYNSSNYRGVSFAESEIQEYIKSLGLDYKSSVRSILSGQHELDLYIPTHKLAIEYNGVYWHREGMGKDRNYHIRKTEECEKLGIQLLHIYDIEWNNTTKRDIWKSIIKAKLGLIDNKIYARKCKIEKIEPKIAREFLDINHLDGFVGAKYHFGLWHKEKLVSVISIGQSRFKDDEWEIIRFASIKDHIVVGGYSKLLSCYTEKHKLISYANRRFSTTLKLNPILDKIGLTSPSWYGFSLENYELKHRLSFSKKNLQSMFKYDQDVSAYDNMLNNGYDRIWDSGNIKYNLSTV